MLAKEEVRLKIQVRNNRLYKLIVGEGWTFRGKPNIAAFCKKVGVGVSAIGGLLNLHGNPFCGKGRSEGDYTPTAKKVAKHFNVLVEDLFPRELYATVTNPKTSKVITLAQLPCIEDMVMNKFNFGGNKTISQFKKISTGGGCDTSA